MTASEKNKSLHYKLKEKKYTGYDMLILIIIIAILFCKLVI